MAGINILIDQACIEIEAMIESLDRSEGDEKMRTRLGEIEQAWWNYPTDIQAKFPDHIRQWFQMRRRQ